MQSTTEYITEKLFTQGFQKYFYNTSWVFIGRIFNLALNFVVSVYVARYLGPSQYGLMSFVVSFTSLCMILGDFGIDSLMIKGLNEKPELEVYWLGTGFFIKIIGALISISLAIIIATFFPITAKLLPLILIFSVSALFQSWNAIDFYFQSKVLLRYSNITIIIVSIVIALFEISFMYMHLHVAYFLLLYPVQYALIALGFTILYHIFGQKMINWKIDPSILSYLLTHSWPFILSGISTAVYSQIDQVFIRLFLDSQTVGVYAVASNLSESWSFIPGLLCSSLFPAIINARKTNTTLFEKRMSGLYGLTFYGALCIAIPITILSPFIIHFLYGDAYSASAILLSISIWSIVGMSLGIVLQQYLIAENKLTLIFCLNFLGMIFNLGLNILLIPKMGAFGAAISNSISYIIPFVIILMLPSLREHTRVVTKGLFLQFMRKI